MPRQVKDQPQKLIIYFNNRQVELNEKREESDLLPVVIVDNPDDIMKGQKEVWNVRIGNHTRVIYDPRGHWRGPKIWIETSEEIKYDEL